MILNVNFAQDALHSVASTLAAKILTAVRYCPALARDDSVCGVPNLFTGEKPHAI